MYVYDILQIVRGNMTKDISLTEDGYKLNYRTAVILTYKGKVLLHKAKVDFWNMPGGRVKYGEDSKNAIIREMQEELGITLKEPQLIAYCENFFNFDNTEYHELLTVYKQELTGNESIVAKQDFCALDNPSTNYHWFKIADVKNEYCLPNIIYKLVESNDDAIIHSITINNKEI